MLITNILATVTTACAVFASTAVAYDMRVKKYGKTDCSSPGGGNLDWSRGECHGLYSTDWGMKVIDYSTNCKSKNETTLASYDQSKLTLITVRGYSDGNCRSKVVTAFSTRQCHTLKGVWSVRVECQ